MKTRTVDNRIDRLARPHHGVVSLAHVVGNGITPDQLRARLDRSSLVRLDEGRRYVLDFAVPAVKVGVEVDGLETRATRESLDHCDERQNRLVLGGWHLLRYTSTHLRERRAAIRRELTRLVESRLHGL
jgi:very-short-patch-repair endonuclease